MKPFSEAMTRFENLPAPRPDFENLLKVLRREKPARYTLFEFFMNGPLEVALAGEGHPQGIEAYRVRMAAFAKAGYDYTTVHASSFHFAHPNASHKATQSANDGVAITDWESYEAYRWNDPEAFYDGRIEQIAPFLPDGMKLLVMGPGGVLENVTSLVGYDNLCYLILDEPELVAKLFEEVGTRMASYYERIVAHPAVGAIISNDDWGFNTQTMFAPEDMRRYVFPYHKKIAALAHSHGKPALLHSCGQLSAVLDDIVSDMQFDAKHSYEDNILSVEQAYERYKDKIAVLGGIDLDFVVRRTPAEIYDRACKLLEQTGCVGYALGTGNSIPEYVPHENYLAMVAAAVHNRD